MVYRKPTSEEGQLDEESIAHVTHVDEVKCVEQCKKIASIQNAILWSNILKDDEGQINSTLAAATDEYLLAGVCYLVHLASVDDFNLHSRF